MPIRIFVKAGARAALLGNLFNTGKPVLGRDVWPS